MSSGVSDGHFGRWNPESGNSSGKWPIVNFSHSQNFPVTLALRAVDGGWLWTCVKCQEEMFTPKFMRPEHVCPKEDDTTGI